jgi:hypothetical protein
VAASLHLVEKNVVHAIDGAFDAAPELQPGGRRRRLKRFIIGCVWVSHEQSGPFLLHG